MYRIAHISDLHISKISLNPFHLLTKRWLGMLNLIFSRKKHYSSDIQLYDIIDLFEKLKVNLVVISGDLTTTALNQEFELVIKFLQKIEDKGIKVLVCPGNHDLYTKKSDRKKIFYRYLSNKKEKKHYPHKELTLKKDKIEVHPLFDNWYFVGLDSAIATSLISSRGHFSKKLEEKLDQVLKSLSSEKVILVNHFPFFDKEKPRKRLARSKQLKELLKKYPNVVFYLHGHTHAHTIADLRHENLPIVLDSGTSGHNKLGRWNLLELQKQKGSLSCYKWKTEKDHLAPRWVEVKKVQWESL